MSDDVRADARRLLQGITPGKWRHCTGPAEGESKAEYLAGCLTNADESLHVVIAQSPAPEYAYVIPALTGDGPTSDANAEFIAAAPELTRGLLAELDRLQDHYSPDEVNRIREVNKNAQRDLVEVAESLKAERDAALATLQQVREIAEEVVNYGGMSVRELADKVVHLADGGAR